MSFKASSLKALFKIVITIAMNSMKESLKDCKDEERMCVQQKRLAEHRPRPWLEILLLLCISEIAFRVISATQRLVNH